MYVPPLKRWAIRGLRGSIALGGLVRFAAAKETHGEIEPL